jgi:hypothetical protein
VPLRRAVTRLKNLNFQKISSHSSLKKPLFNEMVTGNSHPSRPWSIFDRATVSGKFDALTINMMIPHTSYNMNLFKMLCLKLLTYELVYII